VEPAGIATSPSVAVSGETVIVPYSSGELFALRVDNGSPYWNDQLTRTGNVTALTVINDIAGSPVIDRDLVFAISQSGTFVAINLRTGGRVWTRNVGGIQTPLAAGDFVFLVSTEGQVLCLSRGDGRIKWTTDLPAFGDMVNREDPIVWTGPLLVSNRLLLFSSNGKAVSLNPATGQEMNEIDIPTGTFVPPVMARGTLYLLTNDAQLVALR
jgi:outer membrane protein assembly factor BamB